MEYLDQWKSGTDTSKEGSSVNIEDVLSISVIAHELLKYIRPDEILELSLVSRCWRDICRQSLRRRKAYVLLTKPTCSHLQLLNDLLENSTELPFSGLSFTGLNPTSSEDDGCQRCEEYRKKESVITLYPFLFSKLDMKILKINYPQRRNCIADEFLQGILREKAEHIVEMCMSAWPEGIPSLLSYIGLQAVNPIPTVFPGLKIYTFKNFQDDPCVRPVLIREVLLSAPKLACLDGSVPSGMFSEDGNDLMPRFPKNKYHLIKSFQARDPTLVCLLARENPRLECLSLWPGLIQAGKEMMEIARRDVATICESSRESLKVLHCRYNMIMLRFLSGKCFPNLSVLELTIGWNNFYYVNYLLLKSTSFELIFPNLRRVNFRLENNQAGYFPGWKVVEEELINSGVQSWGHHCLSVTTVTVDSPNAGGRGFLFNNLMILVWTGAVQIFPRVQRFYIKEVSDNFQFWNSIGHFLDIESLETAGYYYNIQPNNFPLCLLHMFSGIELEELNYILQDMDDESFLQDWKFAPSRNARIFTFTRAPEIQLCFDHKDKELCSGESVPYSEDMERVFNLAMRWVKGKLQKFKLQVVVIGPCSRNCDPFRLNCHRDFVRVRRSRDGTPDGVRSTWTFEL